MFENRQDAGHQLAQRLQHLADVQPVVLGLPRGGVPVAMVVAEALRAPLDVLVVRKIGAPIQPELAIGAVSNGEHPNTVLNDDVVRRLGISDEYVAQATAHALEEVRRQQSLYRSGRDPINVVGATVIVIDDGIATGATVRAGLRGIRRKSPKRLVLAVPVGPPESLHELSGEVDELVCLHAPQDFFAVGQFYRDFGQTGDADVVRLLNEAAERINAPDSRD